MRAVVVDGEAPRLYLGSMAEPLLSLVRAQDVARLVAGVAAARERAPGLRLVIDSTIATPWAFRAPLLDQGVDVVLGSGTKALGGTDRDLWGYIAANDVSLANSVMDLVAMRGGILDGRGPTPIQAGNSQSPPWRL